MSMPPDPGAQPFPQTATPPAAVNPTQPGTILRDAPEPSESRAALVKKLAKQVRRSKEKFKPAYKMMREDMKFASGFMWAGNRPTDSRVTINIIGKHVNGRVASLYAKNPQFVAKRRKRLDFKIWDGNEASLAAASKEVAASQGMPPALPPGAPPGAPPPPPMAPVPLSPQTAALLQDVQEGIARRRMLDHVSDTLEIIYAYALDEQVPPFKKQLKQMVRRVETCGVGFAKLGYQRELQRRPDEAARLADITLRLSTVERLQEDVDPSEKGPDSAEAEELKIAMAAIQAEPDIVVREGLTFDFPAATRIIPDAKCRQLSGWVGCDWVAEEFLMSCEEIEEVYQVDIGASYTGYTSGSYGEVKQYDGENKKAVVWEIYHKKDGVVYTLCDGYADFLTDPLPPPVMIDQFYPWFPLVFNEIEAEDEIYPLSDVRLLRPIQLEINRMMDALRQHRVANRPIYVAQKGKLENQDLKNLASADAHDVISVNGLDPNDKIENVLQELKRAGVDPNLYETGTLLKLMALVVGTQGADDGASTTGTATESSIEENAKIASTASNSDDMDDMLSSLAKAAGQVLLREMSVETVQAIVGPGAVWPQMNPQQIAEEIYLEVEAGSSGRPNKAQDIANFERLAPILMQIPGINQEWLAQYAIKTLDAHIDYEDAITAGLPSINTANTVAGKQVQPSTGDPATDPASQGPQGGANAAAPPGVTPGPQPALPTQGEQPSALM